MSDGHMQARGCTRGKHDISSRSHSDTGWLRLQETRAYEHISTADRTQFAASVLTTRCRDPSHRRWQTGNPRPVAG